ncbi:MAG: DUF2905 domain-containing protein [Candidatus Harrisonbacteria bacterium]|nr:DUF2905 domain-containing protein [Candidatus Harrisonbacteria bacterium]
MAKIFIIIGIVFIVLGPAWAGKLGPFGRLPGDILIERENFKVYIPIVSMLLLSILISFILLFLQR